MTNNFKYYLLILIGFTLGSVIGLFLNKNIIIGPFIFRLIFELVFISVIWFAVTKMIKDIKK